MRRWLVVMAGAIVLAGAAWAVLRRPAEWTTANAQALAELRLGVEALEKVYVADARLRFERVLELDPGCVAARVFLFEVLSGPESANRRTEILDELRRADPKALNARERFMVTYLLAVADNRDQAADTLLDEFVAAHPKDPFALRLRANRAFSAGRLDEAQREYERLLAVAPNFVVAYNQLGYTAMARGQFAEAERMLRKYRFIAPDQANPHDSLGELLLLRGRYEEAEQEFNQALAVRNDFCASYSGLALLGMVSGRLELTDQVLERAATVPACAGAELERGRLMAARWRAAVERNWPRLAALAAAGPSPEVGSCPWVLTHRAHLLMGREDEAAAVEAAFSRSRTEKRRWGDDTARPCALHMEGARLLAAGRAAEAVAKFEEADAALTYRGAYPGTFKLFNRSQLAEAFRRLGDAARARETAESLRSVNDVFAADLLQALSMTR